MTGNILEIKRQFRLHDDAARLVAVLNFGAAFTTALRPELMKLDRYHQDILVAVFAFEIMGGHLPASMEMLKRLPPFTLLSDEMIEREIKFMCNTGYLKFEDGFFVSPMIAAGIEEAVKALSPGSEPTPT
jgi:hypothetical protein